MSTDYCATLTFHETVDGVMLRAVTLHTRILTIPMALTHADQERSVLPRGVDGDAIATPVVDDPGNLKLCS